MATRNSDAKTLATCAGMFLLSRIVYPGSTSPAMERGTAIHEDIENAIRDGRDFPKKHHPVFDGYDWATARTEVTFERTHPELRYPVYGTVDLLIDAIDGTHTMLVDWKSGKSKADLAQLDLYRFGLGMQGARAIFFYVDKPRATVTEVPYGSDARVLRRIRATERAKESLIEDQVAPFKVQPLCRSCSVRAICPKLTKRGPQRDERMKDLRETLRQLEPTAELMVPA